MFCCEINGFILGLVEDCVPMLELMLESAGLRFSIHRVGSLPGQEFEQANETEAEFVGDGTL